MINNDLRHFFVVLSNDGANGHLRGCFRYFCSLLMSNYVAQLTRFIPRRLIAFFPTPRMFPQ